MEAGTGFHYFFCFVVVVRRASARQPAGCRWSRRLARSPLAKCSRAPSRARQTQSPPYRIYY